MRTVPVPVTSTSSIPRRATSSTIPASVQGSQRRPHRCCTAPATIPDGPRQGFQILADEEELGFELLRSANLPKPIRMFLLLPVFTMLWGVANSMGVTSYISEETGLPDLNSAASNAASWSAVVPLSSTARSACMAL